MGDWFDDRRMLESIGNEPPAEAEAALQAVLEKRDVAAQLANISLRRIRRGSASHLAPKWKTPVEKILETYAAKPDTFHSNPYHYGLGINT